MKWTVTALSAALLIPSLVLAQGTQASDTTAKDSSARAGAPTNQTKSGVTNTKTGKSTLGSNVSHVRPTGVTGQSKGANANPNTSNQTKTGVTNTKTGASTLGASASKVRPTGVTGQVGPDTTMSSAGGSIGPENLPQAAVNARKDPNLIGSPAWWSKHSTADGKPLKP